MLGTICTNCITYFPLSTITKTSAIYGPRRHKVPIGSGFPSLASLMVTIFVALAALNAFLLSIKPYSLAMHRAAVLR